jgi:hypothetical protein
MDDQWFIDKVKDNVGRTPTSADMCYNPEGWVIE